MPALQGSYSCPIDRRERPVEREENESSPRKSQVFNLRCPVCHKEKPYRTSEIVDFEGEPANDSDARPRGADRVGMARTE